jgi:DHA3 family multidrug efflux protein-like MFS transporter
MPNHSPTTIFHHLLFNNLIANTTNNFVWFALTFWVFIETESVLTTSLIAGIFALTNMLGAVFFGSIVDHNRKKTAMMYSSVASLLSFILGTVLYFTLPESTFSDGSAVILWVFVTILMVGTVAQNLRTIALSTTVTMLFAEGKDKANGQIGMVNGLAFSLTSFLSGIAIGFYGMGTALIAACVATLVALIHLIFISLPEAEIIHTEEKPKRMDLRGTIALILTVPGLIALILFNTFNNFLGGIFMALMDPYGLSLVSVEAWGTMWALASLTIIMSSSLVARFGIGKKPLRLILLLNVISWGSAIIFPIQPSIILLGFGMVMWMLLFPIVEAAEQTVIQSVVPFERQGRVFGFASSIESLASPVTVFLVGPLAQFVFIPFMTTGAGVALLGSWFGTGADRGIALVFILSGILGLIMTLLAFTTNAYQLLSRHYETSVTN